MSNEKEAKILKALRNDAKSTLKEISIQTGIATSTIIKIMKKLRSRGVIKRYSALFNNTNTQFQLVNYIINTNKFNFGDMLCINSVSKINSNKYYLKCIFKNSSEEWKFYEMLRSKCKSVQKIQIIETLKEEKTLCC